MPHEMRLKTSKSAGPTVTIGLLSSDYDLEFQLDRFAVRLDSHIAKIPDERTMFQLLRGDRREKSYDLHPGADSRSRLQLIWCTMQKRCCVISRRRTYYLPV